MGTAWLEFLKWLGPGRTGVSVAWLASGFFLFGPKVAPSGFATSYLTLPAAGRWLPGVIFVVSTFALVVWSLQALARRARTWRRRLGHLLARRQPLSHHEQVLLHAFAAGEQFINLEHLTQHFHRLELYAARDALLRRGYIEINPFSAHPLLALTPSGTQFALAMLQQQDAAARR